ncbi:MAG TPA: radical SAM protein [Caulobacteraceae bacterium]|nr:radical SAM protein [Caulobacteraceae bacterium]
MLLPVGCVQRLLVLMGAENLRERASTRIEPITRAWSRVVEGRIRPPDALELIVADHCNIACRQCNHASPAVSKWNLDPADALDQLSRLATVYRPRRVKLIGGEPLLNPKLAEIVRAARASGICEHITLVTNGILISRLSDEAWDLLDEIEISRYPNANLNQRTIELAFDKGAHRGTAVVLNSFDTFRYTFTTVANSDAAQVRKIFAACKIATIWGCHALYKGSVYRCPQSIYVRSFAPGAPQEGIELADDDEFQARLLAFLNATEPLDACRHCFGTCGAKIPHSLVARKAWRAGLDDVDPSEMVDLELLERTQRWKPLSDDCKTEAARNASRETT